MKRINRFQKDFFSFAELSLNSKLLYFQTLFLLPIVSLSIRMFGFNHVYRFMLEIKPDHSHPKRTVLEENDEIIEIVYMVNRTYWRFFKGITCLPKNLVLWWLLKERGIETRLVIGVKRSTDGIIGHAWIEHNGKLINEKQKVTDEYTVIQEIN